MDIVYEQINVLVEKVNTLHEMLSDLNSKVEMSSHRSLVGNQVGVKEDVVIPMNVVGKNSPYRNYHSLASALEHKDVLLDDNYLQNNSWAQEQELSPELQIQRLTAQLTAAYNRIAALEEQLLAVKRSS